MDLMLAITITIAIAIAIITNIIYLILSARRPRAPSFLNVRPKTMYYNAIIA